MASLRTLVPVARVAVASTFARELRAEPSEALLERLGEIKPLRPKLREALVQALASAL